VHNESAEKARRAGIQVVMNMCVMRELQKMPEIITPS
jgi:predicted CoA-binding protein